MLDECESDVTKDMEIFKKLSDEKAGLNKKVLAILEKYGLSLSDINNETKLQRIKVDDTEKIKMIRSRLEEIKKQHKDVSDKISVGSSY